MKNVLFLYCLALLLLNICEDNFSNFNSTCISSYSISYDYFFTKNSLNANVIYIKIKDNSGSLIHNDKINQKLHFNCYKFFCKYLALSLQNLTKIIFTLRIVININIRILIGPLKHHKLIFSIRKINFIVIFILKIIHWLMILKNYRILLSNMVFIELLWEFVNID